MYNTTPSFFWIQRGSFRLLSVPKATVYRVTSRKAQTSHRRADEFQCYFQVDFISAAGRVQIPRSLTHPQKTCCGASKRSYSMDNSMAYSSSRYIRRKWLLKPTAMKFRRFWINPFRAPEPLPILNPSNFVPQNGFPVVKGLRSPVIQKKKRPT